MYCYLIDNLHQPQFLRTVARPAESASCFIAELCSRRSLIKAAEEL